MTEREAIRYLKKLYDNLEKFFLRVRYHLKGEYKNALTLAISALEKQIPKPVKITTSTIRCGECNRQLSGIGNIHSKRNYCQGCGQAIKLDKE